MISKILHFVKVTTPSLTGRVRGGSALLLLLLSLTACSTDSESYDPYDNWQARNAAWYSQVADSARQAIRQAQAQYGTQWEQHCPWRMFKSFQKSPAYRGTLEDSICVHILSPGTGSYSPTYNDTVSIYFRGQLMPTTDEQGNRIETIFDQTYYGPFDSATAATHTNTVSVYTDGFATALQHMVAGDDWMVYIPQQLFYGETSQGLIPSYSAVRFRIGLVKVTPVK